jgi:hypothetical protein
MPTKKLFFAGWGLCATLLLCVGAQAETVTYEIRVNTSALTGTGFLDFQFNGGNTPFDFGSATIASFTTDGTLAPPATPIGDVTGALPGSVTIQNTGVTNDYTPGLTFGSFFDVFVALNIPSLSGTSASGNTFTLDVEDSDFQSLLGAFPAVQIDLDATTGAPTVTNNTGGSAVVTEQLVPEPASLWLVAGGLFLVVAKKALPLARSTN